MRALAKWVANETLDLNLINQPDTRGYVSLQEFDYENYLETNQQLNQDDLLSAAKKLAEMEYLQISDACDTDVRATKTCVADAFPNDQKYKDFRPDESFLNPPQANNDSGLTFREGDILKTACLTTGTFDPRAYADERTLRRKDINQVVRKLYSKGLIKPSSISGGPDFLEFGCQVTDLGRSIYAKYKVKNSEIRDNLKGNFVKNYKEIIYILAAIFTIIAGVIVIYEFCLS